MNGIYDVTIVGGGPAGMFAAFYCGLHKLKTQLVESLPELGGQLTALYPEKQIWDVAGLPGVTGAELVARLKKQLALVNVDQFTGEKVTDVVNNPDGTFTVQSGQRTSQSKSILIALGNGAFHPRPLRLAGAEQVTGKQLHYFIKHKADFAGQRVAVFGGGNTALDDAKLLAGVAKQVTLVHRRDQFRGHELVADQLRAMNNVAIMTPFLPRQLAVNDDQSLTFTLKKMRSTEETTLTVDQAVVNYGFTANNDVLEKWSVGLATDRHQLVVDQDLATSVPGIYAIGDAAASPDRPALIAAGFGQAPEAVGKIVKELYPDKSLAVHSSSMKLK